MKSIKSLYILSLMLIVLMLNSCVKNSGVFINPHSYKPAQSYSGTFSVTADGVPNTYAFSYGAVVTANGFGGTTVFAIKNAADLSSDSFNVIFGFDPVTAGTYTEGNPAKMVSFEATFGGVIYESSATAPDPVTITVTSITAKTIEGTFSGKITSTDVNNPGSKVLTAGKFSVPLP